MIKPVTFQGQFHFNANLYALEVKSRFIDQEHADGYYTNYGAELAAQIVGGNKIQVGTGALVVQGRMFEITAAEILQPQIFDGFKGYVVARIETYHPADDDNCTIISKVQTSFAALDRELEQNDVYAATADNINTAYELPIYSFEISGTQIVNLVKLIKPVCDYATIKTIVDNALATAKSAVDTSNGAVSTANAANEKSDAALSVANAIDGKVTQANIKSDNAVNLATAAKIAADATVQQATDAATVADAASKDVERLEQTVADMEGRIVEKQGGSSIKDDENYVAVLNVSKAPTAGAGALFDDNANLKSSNPVFDNDCVRMSDIVALILGDGLTVSLTTDTGELLEDMGGNALQYILKSNL